jgi:hypothetical protein
MAVFLSLPQELIDLIIDAIYLTNGATPLNKFSVVSKVWRGRSQHYLFKEFCLDSFKMKRIHPETSKTTDPVTLRQRPRNVLSALRYFLVDARGIAVPETYLKVLRFFHLLL